MSNFSHALGILLEKHGLTQVRLSELSRVDQGSISKYFKKDYHPRVEQLNRLIAAFPDPADKAALVIGHLRDETPDDARHLIRIVNLLETPAAWEETPLQLTKERERDLQWLRGQIAINPAISEFIASTVAMMRGE